MRRSSRRAHPKSALDVFRRRSGLAETGICKTKHRDIVRVAADFPLDLIASNLIRIPKPLAA